MKSRIKRVIPLLVWLGAVGAVIFLAMQGLDTPVAPGAAEATEVAVPSPRVARVTKVLVKVGQRVKLGQTLAQLSAPSLQAEIQIAEAQLERLEQAVGAAQAEVKQDSRLASARLSTQAEGAAMDVARLKGSIARARGELKVLKAQHARQKKLVDQQLIPATKLIELNSKIAVITQRIASDRNTLAQAQRHAKAGAKRTEPVAEPELEARLAPHRLAVAVQKRRVEALSLEVERLELKATVSGKVVALHLHPGAVAVENAPVLTIIDDQPKRVVAYADQMWASKVKVGAKAQLTASDGAGKRTGTVAAVGPRSSELPKRFWQVPTHPTFGREILITLDASKKAKPPLPGQAFDVVFATK